MTITIPINYFKDYITKMREDKINQFIGKSSKFNKVGGKMKKSKLKEIIKGYVKEAIQRA